MHWLASIGWTSETVTAISTTVLAVLTVILAFGTVSLWLATKHLVEGSERAAEYQLRAYVMVDRVTLTRIGPDIYGISVALKNVGQTPAHDLEVMTAITIGSPADIDAFSLGGWPERSMSRSVLGPTVISDVGSSLQKPHAGLDQTLQSGARVIHAIGKARYVDVFGKLRNTEFRYHNNPGAPREMEASDRGNKAD
jgi:hypothetical protein